MSRRSENPCYQCEDRYIGCHSKCKKHIKWKKEYREETMSLSKDELTKYVGQKMKVGKV